MTEKMTREQYLALHVCCPRCFSTAVIARGCGAFYLLDRDFGGTFVDSNEIDCGSCGYDGTVHDCVPKSLSAFRQYVDRMHQLNEAIMEGKSESYCDLIIDRMDSFEDRLSPSEMDQSISIAAMLQERSGRAQ